ncbi:MAG: ArsR/SmtB family transcription factor, partial [Tepidisphaeraceae bacterium]
MIKLDSKPASLLSWMGSLADATRLRLLHLLERHELGVVELCDILQLPQSTVSRHLKVLTDGKWLRSRKQGTTHFYRMILD